MRIVVSTHASDDVLYEQQREIERRKEMNRKKKKLIDFKEEKERILFKELFEELVSSSSV